jgi:hypothetical protein
MPILQHTALVLALGALVVAAPPAAAQAKPMAMPIALPLQVGKPKAAPAAPAPEVERGKFRISVVGFDVVAQTWDDAMQRDGKDDEVFVVAQARQLKMVEGTPSVALVGEARSRVMGDIQGFEDARLPAGSASDLGGLKTGDRWPRGGVQARRPGEPRRDALPMLVWQGEISTDTPILVVPTIWEWDGQSGPLDDLVRSLLAPIDTLGGGFDSVQWERWRAGPSDAQVSRGALPGVVERLSVSGLGRNVVGEHAVQESSVVGSAGDRPIGMERVDGLYRFDPWVVKLGYQDALYAAKHDTGAGLGIIKVSYVDGPALRGNYNLYVLVELLP